MHTFKVVYFVYLLTIQCSRQMTLCQLCALLLLAGDIATNPGPINFGLCNMRSLKKNYATSNDFIVSKSLSIMSLTETWLTDSETQSQLAEVTPSGSDLLHRPRVGCKGGGVGFLVDKSLNSSILQIPVLIALKLL